MYSGHRNYTSQFRQRPSPHPPPPLPQLPPPPYHQASPGSALHFLQAAPGPQLPPVPQAPQFFGRLAPPLGQPIPFTHTPSVNSALPYLQPLPPPPPPLAPPPPPPQVNGNTPTVPSYSLANRPISLPLPPPPPRMIQPAPQLNVQPQGQMSYHSLQPSYSTPHPPPWPTNLPNPPTPPNFEMTVPISFPGQNRTTDAHPPAVPSLPPPPPPPPPSSPPPLPPSPPAPIPASDSFSSDALKVLASDFKVDSETLVVDNASAHLVDVSKGFKEGKEILVDLEASENLSLPPPRPDETVIRSIEVLCQFIVKVGPAFENTARAKEAGNPQFAFLFGGEPGSAAAIGHEYFQWMKKKYVLEAEFHKGLKHNALPSSTLATGVSLQSGNLHCVDLSQSPATSDIDMEDDITPADISKGFNIKNEESTISTHACSYAHENVKEQIHSDLYVGIGASSPIAPVMDAEDEKEFSVFEDVSPERGSPDNGDLDGITYSSSRFPTGDAIKGNVLLNTEDKPQEATGVFLKYGSPFRLIQDYASDESDENVKSGDAEDFHPVSPPARTAVISSLKQEKPSELCPNFDAQDFTAAGNESVYKTTSGQHSPSIQQEVATSTENTIMMTSLSKLTSGQHFPSLPLEKVMSQEKTIMSISLSEFNTMNRNNDSDIHQAEKLSEDGRKTLWPTSEYDDLDERKLDADKKTEFFSGSVMEQQVSLDVDEFGRLIRKGASGSESDGSHYTEKHGKRGRSQNRSLSRSPHGSRKRYRSRSARRRDKRSHSHSWSPKRRSKSPLSFRKNMPARRSRDQPPECFNFNRGRCFYGASCRFLHRDFAQHIHSQQRHQDSRKSRYFDGSDDTSLSRISRRDNTGVEMHIEKNNKFVEPRNHVKHVYQGQSDSKTRTISGQFSEGKDEQAPTSETKATEDQVSQEIFNMELEPSGGKGPVKSTLSFVEEESTQLLLESSEPQQADIFQVYSSDGKDSSFSEFPSSADAISLQPSLSTIANVVEAKKCSQHTLDQVSSVLPLLSVQTNYSANDPIQALNSQINVDESNATEATLNQNIATDSKLHTVTSIKTPVQPLSEGFLPQNLLTPGANFQTPQSLPPAPPHGQHPMHIPNDSLTNAFSTQHFKENAMPPMSSYPSQLPSHMLYPPRPHFSGNLLPNNELQQSNLPLYDQYLPPPQNMNTLLRRPPFPSSESFQLPHQQNAMPLRNDFIPAVRPYLSGEIPGSRPSDLFCQPFPSSSPGYPPRHRSAGIEQGGFHLPNQGLTHSGSVPLPRSLQGEEISMPHIRNIHHALQPPLYNRQNPLPANLSSKFDATGSMHPSIRRYTESSFQPQPSDTGLLRFPIREYFNPYASTFEQPLRGPDILGTEIRRIDSAPNADITGFEFGMRASSPGTSKRSSEQTLPKTGSFAHEATAEVVPNSQRQPSQAPASGIPYDPLFDSIEPSSDTSKLRAEEQNSGINDTGSASKLNSRRPKAGSKKRRGASSAAEVKVEVDELGEVATDADAGGVENESPQLLDKDWSPPNPFDGGDANVGEIEITQVRSPGKSKKSRDSRSMRLFKVAIADFAKEVLKPSWRQGNLSKEAFKTIVKKTVDKVAGALPSHQLPKSQAKINHYMESSQRKLTKLVMGYVDKYVKM